MENDDLSVYSDDASSDGSSSVTGSDGGSIQGAKEDIKVGEVRECLLA